MRRVKLRVVVFEFLLNSESMLLVEVQGGFIVRLNMEDHSVNLFTFDTVLDGLCKTLRSDSIATVRFQNCDSHKIDLYCSVFFMISFSRNCGNQNVLEKS